jgi:hypothetical protein
MVEERGRSKLIGLGAVLGVGERGRSEVIGLRAV